MLHQWLWPGPGTWHAWRNWCNSPNSDQRHQTILSSWGAVRNTRPTIIYRLLGSRRLQLRAHLLGTDQHLPSWWWVIWRQCITSGIVWPYFNTKSMWCLSDSKSLSEPIHWRIMYLVQHIRSFTQWLFLCLGPWYLWSVCGDAIA